jgi:2-methylcitrate dehydratase
MTLSRTMVERLAAYVEKASPRQLSPQAREALKVRLLDSLGCAIGALSGEPVRMVRSHVEELSRAGPCVLIGGGSSSIDLAALFNSTLVRYLDFNDSYLAPGETCHPSDNLGAILAAAESASAAGEELLVALAVSYQVQCRLSDEAPVRAKGFDHTVQGSYGAAAGIARALRLDRRRTASAIAIAGTAQNALRVTRTGELSHWKGLAAPAAAFGATHAALLARQGITGPREVFEGNKGFMETISGRFEIDWEREDLERVRRTILKRFNAEIHSQSTLEGVLELLQAHRFRPEEVREVEIETFQAAYDIIGGGEEGEKTLVRTKEEADHSLKYMVAVAILDGEVTPDQYLLSRLRRPDVQALLKKVVIRPAEDLTRRFPEEMGSRVAIRLAGGGELRAEKRDYEGFHTRPMRWERVVEKFERLAAGFAEGPLRREMVQAVESIETIPVSRLTGLLARVRSPARGGLETQEAGNRPGR